MHLLAVGRRAHFRTLGTCSAGTAGQATSCQCFGSNYKPLDPKPERQSLNPQPVIYIYIYIYIYIFNLYLCIYLLFVIHLIMSFSLYVYVYIYIHIYIYINILQPESRLGGGHDEHVILQSWSSCPTCPTSLPLRPR